MAPDQPKSMNMWVQLDDRDFKQMWARVRSILVNMKPMMKAIGHIVEADVKTTLKRGGEGVPGGPFKPVKDRPGGTPLLDTGQHIRNRLHVAEVGAHHVTVVCGWRYAHVHHYGATIKPVNAEYLKFKTRTGGFVQTEQVEIPARPFMQFRPETPQKIALEAAAHVQAVAGNAAVSKLTKGLGL